MGARDSFVSVRAARPSPTRPSPPSLIRRSPPCSDTPGARANTLTERERRRRRGKKMVSHARTHYSSLLPSSAPPVPVSAVLSHSLHAPTPTRCRGGRGWIYTSRCRPRASLRLGTRLQCEKTTSKKTLKPGVEVPTSSSGAFFRREETQTTCFSDSAGLSAWKLRQLPIGPTALCNLPAFRLDRAARQQPRW